MKPLSPSLRLILGGAFAVLFVLAAVVYLPHAAGILAVTSAILLLPIPAWQRWLRHVLKGTKPVFIAAVCVGTFLIAPTRREPSATPVPSTPIHTTQSTTHTTATTAEQETTYVLNRSSKKFHLPHCANAQKIKDENRGTFTGTAHQLEEDGYSPCGNCLP